MLDFSCFVPLPLVVHSSEISLDFGLEGLYVYIYIYIYIYIYTMSANMKNENLENVV